MQSIIEQKKKLETEFGALVQLQPGFSFTDFPATS